MSRYVIVGSVPGALEAFIGAPRVLATLHAALEVVRVDLTLTDAASGPVVVRVTDGATPIDVTLAGGATHVSLVPPAPVLWPAGAAATLEITAAAAGGLNLLAQLFVEERGALAAAGTGLVGLADVKAALGITGVDAARDAWLQRAILAASRRIRDYCGRYLSPATIRAEWFGPGVVHVPEVPVVSITSAVVDGATLNPSTGVKVDLESGRLWRLASPSSPTDWHGASHLEVVYESGYAVLPEDLAELVYSGLAARWAGYQAGTQGLGSAEGVSRIQFADGGAVSYQTAAAYGGGVVDAPDYLLGFPLSMLDAHRDHTRQLAPVTSSVWGHLVP